MTDWLFDTFIYTGVLIAAVLLLRRPVARHFGPQVAYALWALPLLRLIMPPIVLPSSFAPAEAVPVEDPVMIYISATPETVNSQPLEPIHSVGIEMADLLLPFWLGGAALFLALRARDYLRMRRDLLEQARPVGEAGKVRLVETPAVTSPVAFGVSDKVVALPPQFMALHDIAARDLAIAHELAHHRGHDLVANIAAQPLLALHWFNPLAWWGWRAMRRDQEAACDARVVAGKERSERAAYAEVIAGFAAGPHLALAAPMACPVLGEKSIIHRLRSLTMSDIPSGRKKLGIAAIATTALAALPLTASISYAQNEAPEVPELPSLPAVPAPPAAPDAPLPPAPPAIESIDPDMPHRTVRVHVEHDGEGGEEAYVIRRRFAPHDGEQSFTANREFIDEEEMKRMFAELEIEMEELEGMEAHIEIAMAEGQRALAMAERAMPRFEVDCDGAETVQHRQLDNGRQVTIICQTAISNQLGRALQMARRAVASSPGLSDEERQAILEELEREIEQAEPSEVSAVTKSRIRARTSNVSASNVHAGSDVRSAKTAAPATPVLRTSAARLQSWAPAFDEVEAADDCEDEESGFSA